MSQGMKKRAAKKPPPTVADYLIVADCIIGLGQELKAQFGMSQERNRDAMNGLDAALMDVFTQMQDAIERDHEMRRATIAALEIEEGGDHVG